MIRCNFNHVSLFLDIGTGMNFIFFICVFELGIAESGCSSTFGNFLNGAMNGDIECVMEYIENDGDVNTISKNKGNNALHMALNGHDPVQMKAIVAYLLKNEIDMNAENDDGFQPAHYLYKNENLDEDSKIEIIKQLCSYGPLPLSRGPALFYVLPSASLPTSYMRAINFCSADLKIGHLEEMNHNLKSELIKEKEEKTELKSQLEDFQSKVKLDGQTLSDKEKGIKELEIKISTLTDDITKLAANEESLARATIDITTLSEQVASANGMKLNT